MLLLAVATGAGVGIGSLLDDPAPTASPTPSSGAGFVGPQATRTPDRVGPPGDVLDAQDRLRVDGLGPVGVGMSLRQASAAAGVPLRSVEDRGCAFAEPAVEGVRFLLQRGRITRVDVTGSARTLSGIGVGSTVAQARATYGRRLVATGRALRFRGTDPLYALRLEVEDGRVAALRAGLASAVDDDRCARPAASG